jgi:hypothetical protein
MSSYFTILIMTWLTLRHNKGTIVYNGALGTKALTKTYEIIHLELILARPLLSTIYGRITPTCASCTLITIGDRLPNQLKIKT